MALADKKCAACTGELPVLGQDEITVYLEQLKGWSVLEGKKLTKSYRFPNFKEAMDLANRIAELAEAENHHPDLLVRWGQLVIELWTHKTDGLTESDFVLAAKIDRIQA